MNFWAQTKLLRDGMLGLIAITTLTGCSTGIKKEYNELDRKFTCRLEHNVKRETFTTLNNIKIMIEKNDDHNVSFLVSLVSFSYLTNMHTDPKIMFKIYSGDKVTEEFNFQAVSKHWDKSIIVSSQSPYNLDYASTIIDKKTFEKIINAEKIELLVQTNQDPAKFILSKMDLKAFHRFLATCF